MGYYKRNVIRERSYDGGKVHNIQHSGNILRCNKRVHGRRGISRPLASTGVRKVMFYARNIQRQEHSLFQPFFGRRIYIREKKQEYCEFHILKGPHYMSRIFILYITSTPDTCHKWSNNISTHNYYIRTPSVM